MSSSSTPALRLQAVVNHTTAPFPSKDKAPLLLVLPDGGKVNTLASGAPEGTTEIVLNDIIILSYTISETEKFALDISSVGTRYQGATKHLPRYSLVVLSAPKLANGRVKVVSVADLWVAIYALFTQYHTQENIPVTFPSLPNATELTRYLIDSGLAQRHPKLQVDSTNVQDNDNILFLSRSVFWQGAGTVGFHHRSWNLSPKPIFPSVMTFTRSEKAIAMHPLRPSKPQPGEVLYRRWCSDVKQHLEIAYFDIDGEHDGSKAHGGGVSRHMAAFHRWHNDERVNSAWGERGSLETHREYVETLLADSHVLPCMLSWDNELMGYVEIVYTKEDHVAQHFPTGVVPGDWERGIHVLAGEEKFVRTGRSELWIRSLLHYIFLADPRTDRVMAEPSVDNLGIQRVGEISGFHVETVFDFPYKRSTLIFNPRERFFKLCKLR